MNMAFRNLLKTEPPEAVRSLDELFAIAQAMEHEAGERYRRLAERMQAEGRTDLAELFARLSSDEAGHETSVLNWSRQRIQKAPDPATIRWKIPETFDEETAAELASSQLINAYRVLSMAVRYEERAFALWSHIAALAENAEIQQAAERMAREELEHASLLRRARRSAFHAERTARPDDRPRSVGELIAIAAVLERRLAGRLEALAGTLTGTEARRARELVVQTRAMAERCASLAPAAAGAEPVVTDDPDAAAVGERLVETYVEIGDRSRDEVVLAQVQSLAELAIARLAWLRLIA
jgi:rubrerythrin